MFKLAVLALLIVAVAAAGYDDKKYEYKQDYKAESFQHQEYKAHSVPIKVPVVHEYKQPEYKKYESKY